MLTCSDRVQGVATGLLETLGAQAQKGSFWDDLLLAVTQLIRHLRHGNTWAPFGDPDRVLLAALIAKDLFRRVPRLWAKDISDPMVVDRELCVDVLYVLLQLCSERAHEQLHPAPVRAPALVA